MELHDDHFPDPRTRDEVWLPEVAKRGWIALSGNKAIREVKEQRDAAMRGGLALFFLIGRPHHSVLIPNIVRTAGRVIQFREKREPPFIANVHRPPLKYPVGSRPGSVEMSLTKAQWEAMLAAGE